MAAVAAAFAPSPPDDTLADRINARLAELEERHRLDDARWTVVTDRLAAWTGTEAGQHLALAFLAWCLAHPERIGDERGSMLRSCVCDDGYVHLDVGPHADGRPAGPTVRRCYRCLTPAERAANSQEPPA
jgi:hypothetical protein